MSSLSPEEVAECQLLRRQNAVLRAENEILQRRLDEERSSSHRWQHDGHHHLMEANACRASIEEASANTQIVALYDELQRLRKKCDVYAEAVEESRSHFLEMKRLYAELEPQMRPSTDAPHREV